MVEPSRRWISMERAGVNSWVEPSRCDWKVTPSGVSFLSFASDIT